MSMLESNTSGSQEEPRPVKRAAPRRPRAWWSEQVEAWRLSGLSKAAFCAEHGLNAWTFDNWCVKLKRGMQHEGEPGTPSKFVAATIPVSEQVEGVTLSVGEVSLRFDGMMSAEAMAAWVRVLRTGGC